MAPASPPDLNESRILAVDDSPGNLLAYKSILGDLDAVLITASSGEKALQCLETHPVSLIILDVQMPEMNGLQTAEAIRQRSDSRDTPIIFATATDEDENFASAGYELGAVDYIVKPLNPRTFRAKVKFFLELAKKTQKVAEQTELLEKTCAELRRSNEEFQDFAHAASHDLKAPLRQITGFSQLLQLKLSGDDNTQALLEQVVAGAGRMRNLIDHLLLYSRAGRNELQSSPTDLSQVLDEVLADMATAITEAQAQIEVKSLPTIDGDRAQLYQVLQNLLSNAVKYSSPGERPRIEVDWLELPEEKAAPRRCQVRVKDNGIGFEQSRIEEVFQPFRRLVGEGEYEGSGIGLATARRIVERHGGSLNATSRPNYGSTFTVTLPFVHQMRCEAAVPPSSELRLK